MNIPVISFSLLYFSIFAFLGWIIESTSKSLREKEFVNSGSLYGPFIPIFGFGAISIYIINEYIHSFPLFFQLIIFASVPTMLEYFTSYLMEKIFSIRLWDYSERFLNIKGRICLKTSIIWFLLAILHLLYLHPLAIRVIKNLSTLLQSAASITLLVYFSIDIFLSSKLYLYFSTLFRYILKLSASSKNLPLLQGIKPVQFLTPLRKFSYLSKQLQRKLISLPEFPLLIKNRLALSIPSLNGNYQQNEEFQLLLKDTVNHPAYQRLKEFHHHDQNIYEHCIKVAWVSYNLAIFLSLNVKETVRGALLHDLFYYNWREQDETHKFHAFKHAGRAYKNALQYFSPLSAIEKDIILKHMWPLSLLPPKYMESIIVSLADKMVATKEFSRKYVNQTVKLKRYFKNGLK